MNGLRFICNKLRALKRPASPRGIILLYHRIAEPQTDPWNLCVSPSNFADHMSVLHKFQPVPVAELQNSTHPQPISVTFDDGYADNLHCAGTVLHHYDVPATFFLTSGYLGGDAEFWWDELERRVASHAQHNADLELSIEGTHYRWHLTGSPDDTSWLPTYMVLHGLLQPLAAALRRDAMNQIGDGDFARARRSHRVLTVDEVTELASCELFDIGAHTVTHPRLSAQSWEEQLAEMDESRNFLDCVTGRSIQTFSYPYGGPTHYSPASIEMARTAGFSSACTTVGKLVNSDCNPLELPRVAVEDMDGDSFEYLLNQYFNNN